MNAQEAHDALLTWCSELGSGSYEQFRGACRHLGLESARSARNLSGLGHVEFDWRASRFAAAPTTITAVPGLPGQLLLTGARPHGLIAALSEIAQGLDLDVDISRDLCHQFGRGPSTMFIDANPIDAAAFCDQAGIRLTPCAAEQLARLLPDITLEHATVAHRPDDRFPHAIVDPHTFQPRWDQVPDRPEGLWMYRTWKGRRDMVLDNGEREPRLALDPDAAVYLMRRPDDSDPIVEYRRAHHLLVVNAAAPLPSLHARCACLCSGRLPLRRDVAPGIAYDHYVNINPQVAHQILRSLGEAGSTA